MEGRESEILCNKRKGEKEREKHRIQKQVVVVEIMGFVSEKWKLVCDI